MADRKTSPRPKLRPESFATATSPKPRLRPSEDEVRYVDAVFRGEDGDIITSPEENNPVTMLGLTDGDTFRQYPNDLNIYGAYLKPSDTAEGGPHKSKLQELYAREKPDSPPLLINDILIAGESGVENRYTAAHEFMHRGFNVLRNNHNFDEVSERFGRATAQILFSSEDDDFLEHALVQSILEKEGKIAGIDYASKDYLKGVSKETRDKLNKSVEDIYELSNETLGEAGYQTDRDRGPTTRQGRRGAKPKSFWSFITEKLGFAEGGEVAMNEQMSFAFEDGGLRDDGMMRDPVSGNEVPPGSTAKEVRDDIPAQLSEGEYVVPADVVRYYGVKFFEDLRDAAKMGLQDMEARGRIGGEPVPVGGPTNGEDLSPEEIAAINEMMGMAEGGVVNMYKQQQDLYSAPNPAIGNPTANMNQGGTVAGYQPGGSVATDQDFLQAGQQAQQRRFAGFPLGATIFPSAQTGQTVLGPEGTQVATTDAIGGATSGATATDDSALVTVTLYGPNGEIRTLTLPTDQAIYDQLIAQGWSTEMPVAGAITDSDDKKEEVETDPNAWMNKFNYNDFNQLADQTSETLTRIPFGGVIGALGNGTKAAQAAANIIIMKANGYDTKELEKELKKFKKETGVGILGNLVDGDRLARDIVKNNVDLALTRDATDLQGDPIFKDDNDFNDFMQEVAPTGMTYDPTLKTTVTTDDGGTTVVTGGYSRDDDSPSAGEILGGTKVETTSSGVNVYTPGSSTIRPVLRPSSSGGNNNSSSSTSTSTSSSTTTKSEPSSFSQAFKEARAEQGAGGTFTYGGKSYTTNYAEEVNEGGLMMSSKPKKKTRKYNKGGLAGKKK